MHRRQVVPVMAMAGDVATGVARFETSLPNFWVSPTVRRSIRIRKAPPREISSATACPFQRSARATPSRSRSEVDSFDAPKILPRFNGFQGLSSGYSVICRTKWQMMFEGARSVTQLVSQGAAKVDAFVPTVVTEMSLGLGSISADDSGTPRALREVA